MKCPKVALALVIILALGIFSVGMSAANDGPAEKLQKYQEGVVIKAAGMCDQFRSPIVVFTGPNFKKMVFFAPIANSDKQFYVVETETTTEYFLKEFVEGSDGKRSAVVKQLPVMEAYQELAQLSQNFLYFLFFPKKQHDCIIQDQNPSK